MVERSLSEFNIASLARNSESEIDSDLSEMLNASKDLVKKSSLKYGFDFNTSKPLQSSPNGFQWERVPNFVRTQEENFILAKERKERMNLFEDKEHSFTLFATSDEKRDSVYSN